MGRKFDEAIERVEAMGGKVADVTEAMVGRHPHAKEDLVSAGAIVCVTLCSVAKLLSGELGDISDEDVIESLIVTGILGRAITELSSMMEG